MFELLMKCPSETWSSLYKCRNGPGNLEVSKLTPRQLFTSIRIVGTEFSNINKPLGIQTSQQ